MFLVGEYFGEKSWGFVGVFDSEEKAKSACGSFQNRFFCPVTLNEISPDEDVLFENVVYPNVEGENA